MGKATRRRLKREAKEMRRLAGNSPGNPNNAPSPNPNTRQPAPPIPDPGPPQRVPLEALDAVVNAAIKNGKDDGRYDFRRGWKWVVAAILSVAGIVGITYSALDATLIKGHQETNQRLQAQLEDQRKEYTEKVRKLEESNKVLSLSNQGLIVRETRPHLVYPADGSSLVLPALDLIWQHREHGERSHYDIEVLNMRQPDRAQIFKVEGKQDTHIYKAQGMLGRNFWRVRQVRSSDRAAISPWSSFSEFYMDTSALARVMRTGQLRVATHPFSHPTPFNYKDPTGTLVGIEVDLIRHVAQMLGAKLNIPIDVVFVEFDWTELMRAVGQNKADLAIGSFAPSLKRESTYGVRFSSGYLTAHQRFLATKGKYRSLDELKGVVVGVFKGTTNADAAEFLSRKLKFKVQDTYTRFRDIYGDLYEGKIEFALVDEHLASYFADKRFEFVGPALDDQLKEFFKQQLGREREEYAIVCGPKPLEGNDILTAINEILVSPETQQFVGSLLKKYIHSHEGPKTD